MNLHALTAEGSASRSDQASAAENRPVCRFCGAALNRSVVDLGMSPLCESFLAADELDRIEPSLLANYQTGVTYQFYHMLALFVVVLALSRWPSSSLPVWAGWLFVAGIVLFSGSLYVMAFTGQRWLGAVTPIGGVAFIAGWLLLAWTAWSGK